MKRFGISDYQLENVKQNWKNLRSSAMEILTSKKLEVKEAMSEELDQLLTKANESLVSLNRWLKEPEVKLSSGGQNGSGQLKESSAVTATDAAPSDKKPEIHESFRHENSVPEINEGLH